MIISHKHRFIFIKTGKTAGTSMEIALSKYCGPDDIITPFNSEEDERTRQEMGYPGAQNYNVPLSQYSKTEMIQALYNRKRIKFREHVGASFIRKYIEADVWDNYFKFCIERNPFDKVVSSYHWRYKKKMTSKPTLSEFIQSGEGCRINGFELYSRDSRIIVDRVYKFEELDDAMQDLQQRFGLEDTPVLGSAKTNIRKDRRSYREVLSEEDRKIISCAFAREIQYFGYEW